MVTNKTKITTCVAVSTVAASVLMGRSDNPEDHNCNLNEVIDDESECDNHSAGLKSIKS